MHESHNILLNFENVASGGFTEDMIVIMTIFIRESMKIVIMKAAKGPLWPYLNALSQWFSWQNWCSCYISLKVKLCLYLYPYLHLYLYPNALSQWFSWQNWCSCYISLKVNLCLYLYLHIYLYLNALSQNWCDCYISLNAKLYLYLFLSCLYLNALLQWCAVARLVQLADFTQSQA